MSEQSSRSRHAGLDQKDDLRVREGGCLCGAVRFSVRGDPLVVGTCHCGDCRKATGAAFVFYADWPRSAFSSAGQVQVFKGRSFCPTCGSYLMFSSVDSPREVSLNTASFDTPEAFPPRKR